MPGKSSAPTVSFSSLGLRNNRGGLERKRRRRRVFGSESYVGLADRAELDGSRTTGVCY